MKRNHGYCLSVEREVLEDQKPLRKQIMALYGADVSASPSNETEFGGRILSSNPRHLGTLGIAISS